MRWMSGCIAAVLLCPTAHAVIADRSMTYSLHETPSDPQSAVLYTVLLELDVDTVTHNKGDDGGTVLWDIDRISITETATGRNWKKVLTAATWTTTHADLAALDDGEFLEPPLLSGTAVASAQQDPDLEFEVEGVPYGGQQYYAPTAGLDYLLEEVAGATLGQAEDEPVEVDGVEE